MKKLETIQAESMAAALAEVKRRLGPDAVIVHTRTVERRALLGVGGRRHVEITAAASSSDLPGPRASANLPQTRRARARAASPSAEGAAPTMRHAKDQALRTAVHALRAEIGELKELVEDLAAQRAARQPAEAAPEQPAELRETHVSLLANAVSRDLAAALTARLREHLTSEQLADPAAVRAALRTQVAALLPVAGEITLEPGTGPKVVALIGPTGVGKTTTIAKLAADFALRKKKRTGLITLDTYRIAAAEQLRTYAEIIAVPLRVAASARQMETALAELADCDVILIDTAGRSPDDGAAIESLAELLAVAPACERHLVLSATGSSAVLERAIAGFAPAGVDRVLFTKLDEAVGCGVMLDCLRQARARLSYVTTGQQVPADIAPADAGALADRLIDGQNVLGRVVAPDRAGIGFDRGGASVRSPEVVATAVEPRARRGKNEPTK
jgi:flagellar biosynthesis protein FlhF